MDSYFSKIIDRYFLKWIGPDTWASFHPLDMERFYQFVKAIKRYRRNNSKYNIRHNIIKAVRSEHPNLNDEFIEKMCEKFSGIAHHFLEYSSAPFPIRQIERGTPLKHTAG